MLPVIQEANREGAVMAELAAQERLLNAYLRETGRHDPRLDPADLSLSQVPPELLQLLAEGAAPMAVELTAIHKRLIGIITYHSLSGHHQYGDRFWASPLQSLGFEAVQGVPELAALLIGDLSAREPSPEVREERSNSLLAHIANSLEKTALYLSYRLEQPVDALPSAWTGGLLPSEQALATGHPFHPTPKSSEGFSIQDLQRYGPELGASFPLEYFAVAPDLVQEEFLPGAWENAIPSAVREAAVELLRGREDWPLIPCHPWQVAYLLQDPWVRQMAAEGLIIRLGPLGALAYPTSSVRTVWTPDHGSFIKLPLNVRITNFIRVNPPDQLQRSMDASRVMAALQRSLPLPDFTALLETGFRTVAPPDLEEPERDRIAGSFGVLFRQGPCLGEIPEPMVVASLLEPSARDHLPPLAAAVREAARVQAQPVTAAFVAGWLHRYLEVSLLPVLRCFVQGGVSLEAHVQNSMVVLDSGWPVHFYVRDLEGASISRERAAVQGLFGVQLCPDSPALYSDAQAWHRLKYYFLVNHLGHLIFTLARYTAGDEADLWQLVRSVLQANADWIDARYLEDLLTSETLPAKANLISRFQGRGETPLYVPMPNPLRKRGA